MTFRFSDYDSADLARCGEAFSRLVHRTTGERTSPADLRTLALAWLDARAADGALSVAGPVLRELGAVPQALDLAHIDLSDGSLLLAVTYEPPGHDTRYGYVYLLARAAALAATKSRSKLLISSGRGTAAHQLLVDCVLELREQLGDSSPWLWLEAAPTNDEPSFTLLEQR
jgi:hypothetical protein